MPREKPTKRYTVALFNSVTNQVPHVDDALETREADDEDECQAQAQEIIESVDFMAPGDCILVIDNRPDEG